MKSKTLGILVIMVIGIFLGDFTQKKVQEKTKKT